MQRRGFTLIELLVVIAIIAILAAILFPVFAKAREKARQTSCLNNVKQISLALLQYCQDYDETFPNIFQWHGSWGDITWGIIQDLAPYVKNSQVHNCPSADLPSDPNSSLGSRSYSYHYTLLPSTGTPGSLSQIVRPSEIVLMADAVADPNVPGRLLYPSYGPLQEDYDGKNCRICGGAHKSFFGPPTAGHGYASPGFNVLERHNGIANVGFCDGHAKAMKHTTLYNNGNNSPYFTWNS